MDGHSHGQWRDAHCHVPERFVCEMSLEWVTLRLPLPLWSFFFLSLDLFLLHLMLLFKDFPILPHYEGKVFSNNYNCISEKAVFQARF